MARQWYFDRCREVQTSPDGHLDLWAAREYGNPGNITFALTIDDILNDPEVTVGIFSPSPSPSDRHDDMLDCLAHIRRPSPAPEMA